MTLLFLSFGAGKALAFDSQSVYKMHTKVQNLQTKLGNITTTDRNALRRIRILEIELRNMHNRLLVLENSFERSALNIRPIQPSQPQLEDPYATVVVGRTGILKEYEMPKAALKRNAARTGILKGFAAPSASVQISQDIIANPAIDDQEELNTIPEALRVVDSQPTLKAKAFSVTAITRPVQKIATKLGEQKPDIMAFNQAKGYFDDGDYGLAERKFNQFIQYYRDSSLVSNAYYWLGESYYIRGNYAAAAQVYYRGYRNNKKGAKAPDNLYKLASSLLLLGNKSDACSAFYEVDRRYSKTHPILSGQAKEAQIVHKCS